MADESPTAGIHPLVAEELIDDRALTERAQDLLGLGDFVDEVADLVQHVPVPANIALFGSWGAGKSSLANLLKGELETRGRALRFIRFDAFKYAEVPLRRHFLSQVAKGLGIEDDRFEAGLYRTISSNTIAIPKKGLGRLVRIGLGSFFGVALFVALMALPMAWVDGGPFGRTYARILSNSLTGILLSAPLVTAIVALAGKALTVTGSRAAPSGEEEFERLFRELVSTVKKKQDVSRLVIFIDELDRCSPAQVVSVLETLRTFLEVPPCVFVVAADKHVLERALSKEARQATPADPMNPYYSAGSAYLDKVFQYQMDLPPLLPRRLIRFALTLTENRPGAWSQLPNRTEVISVLVPTHVRSPRRVKVLLNNFVVTYRLAMRKAAGGMLEPEVARRASELAKLVCLRTEFPLFANDLAIDHRLPEYVLLLSDDPDADVKTLGRPHPSDQVVALARAYSTGELPLDEILGRPTIASSSTGRADGDIAVEQEEAEEEGGEGLPDGVAPENELEVQAGHSQQLIRYLRKTKAIPNPRRDLIFLEGAGSAFGLDSQFADQLEADAVDGQVESVEQAITDLSAEEQLSAYRFLAQIVTESVGIEATNATSTLLHAVSVASTPIAPVADDLMGAVIAYGPRRLGAKDLNGALRLSVESKSPRAQALAESLLKQEEVLADASLRNTVLRFSPELFPIDSHRVADVIAVSLRTTDASEVLEAVSRLGEEELSDCVRLATDTLKQPLDEISEQETGVDETDRPLKEQKATYCQAIADFALAASSTHGQRVTAAATEAFLDFDLTEARDAAQSLLEEIAPISDSEVAFKVLASTRPRALEAWRTWLGSISPEAITPSDTTLPVLEGLVNRMWLEATKQSPVGDDILQAAIHALRQLVGDDLELSGEGISDHLDANTTGPVASSPQIAERKRRLAVLNTLTKEHLVGEHIGASAAALTIAGTLKATVAPSEAVAMAEFLVETFMEWSGRFSETQVAEVREAIDASPWLQELHKTALSLLASVDEKNAGREPEHELESSDLAGLLGQGVTLDRALERWALAFEPGPQAVWNLLAGAPNGQVPGENLRSAIAQVAAGWSPAEKATLLNDFISAFVASRVSEDLGRMLRLYEAEERIVLKELKAAYEAASNNHQRERVLLLWSLLNPKGETVQRGLVDAIYLPLIGRGKGAQGIAIDNFRVVEHVPGVRRRIRHVLLDATQDDRDLRRRAQRVMAEAGWMRRRFGIFGRYQDVDSDQAD